MGNVRASTDEFEMLLTYGLVDQCVPVAGARDGDDSWVAKVLRWFSSPQRRRSSQPCLERGTMVQDCVPHSLGS